MKRDKDGNIEWSPEEDAAIEAGAESRYRAAKRLRSDEQARKCKRGEHDFDGETGKEVCVCGVKKSDAPDDNDEPPVRRKEKSKAALIF